MTTTHKFGGKWTEDKLNRLRKYLQAYITIFKSNERAKFLRTIYMDGFAGTGYISSSEREDSEIEASLFNDRDVRAYKKGSVQIALDIEPSFDKYFFIEAKPDFVQELEELKKRYPAKARKMKIIKSDANAFIQKWCKHTNWHNNRAVVFLDPYGMQVEWATLKTIADTLAIDLWLLFPLGQAVNRMLTRNNPPKKIWEEKLTRLFGTDAWKVAFYEKQKQVEFLADEKLIKTADFSSIGRFFVERLESIFTKVADNPLPLYNSKNVPIFLLCFAAGNPKGASTAVKIAQDILGR